MSRNLAKITNYLTREGHLLEEWWKNHIQNNKNSNVAFLNNYLNLCDALRFKDANKWEAAMQCKKKLVVSPIWCPHVSLPSSTHLVFGF